MSITVSLDTSADPPVTCNPAVKVKDHGDNTVTWVPASGSTFTFCGLEIASTDFSKLNLSDDKITIKDDNGTPGDYPYTLYVRCDGQFYSTEKSGPSVTEGSPMIQNK